MTRTTTEFGDMCICSTQSENLHNLEIVLRILKIQRLRDTCAQSQDRKRLFTRQRLIYCVARRMEDILDKQHLPPWKHIAIWKSEQCCVLMSNGRGVGRVRSLPGDRNWPQSTYMPHGTGSILMYTI